METQKQIVPVDKTFSLVPVVKNVQDLLSLGKMFELSGMFGCNQQGQGTVLVMTCLSEGISPLRFTQTYHIIDGKISMRADAMLAKFVQRGGKYKIIERSETRAAAKFEKDGNVLDAEFTIEEAQKRHLTISKTKNKEKDSWLYNPKQMLWARLVSDNVRTLDPGVNHGTYTPEEVSDFDDSIIDVGPESEQAASTEPIQEGATTQGTKDDAPFPEEKAESEKPDKLPEEPAETVKKDDPKLVPYGKQKGRFWSELTDKQLEAAAKWTRPEITDAHRKIINKEIERRAKAKK